MNDYDKLKGTELSITYCNGRTVKCFVADINKDKGVTIKELDTQEDAICLNKSRLSKLKITEDEYNELFNYIVESIKSGVFIEVDNPLYQKNIKYTSTGFSPCAFK